MPSTLEFAANLVNLVAVLLAARNSVHTWSSGILGCLLFGWLFYESQLYAEVTLQGFFVITSAIGWWAWLRGSDGAQLAVSNTAVSSLLQLALLAV